MRNSTKEDFIAADRFARTTMMTSIKAGGYVYDAQANFTQWYEAP